MFLGHTACAGSRSAISHAPSAFTYEKLTLENAVFDELYATAQPIGDFDGTIPENWTFDTYLHASFSGNLYGGNVNFTEDLVEAIRIKRRTKKDAQFQTIYEKPIYENEDFAIELLDYLEPAGPVEYAYVPVISGGESNYIITSVTSAFEGYFLCEKDRSFHLFLDASYSQTLNYDPVSVKPLGRKYPVMVINGDAGYLSGEMECLFLPFSEEDADTSQSLSYRELVYEMLTDRKPKILKDSEGNLLLVSLSGKISEADRQYLYHQGQGFSYVKSRFSWTETGDAYDIGDLYDNGLIDTDLDRR